MADEILCSIQDGIATLTLNRPEKRNAINQAMIESLTTHFSDLEQHRDVRVVVIRGAGKVFCAGRDLREMGQQQNAEGTDTHGCGRTLSPARGVASSHHCYGAR